MVAKDYSLTMKYQLGKRLRDLPGPVLLTGHTGFKGTWMTFLLEHLNVPVVGYSLPAEKGSLYARAERNGEIPEMFADIRDHESLEKFIDLYKPSIIIHMAAQPLVLKSYEYPKETFDVNVMGTVNLLDIAFKNDFIDGIAVITTDKVYRNDNSGHAFIESDPLEGKDPYSASKVGTEAVVTAWQQIARISGGPRVVSLRAGNVIGGGDFAENRIIPDLVRAYLSKEKITVRNPNSTRPWQHVLDPLHGYILAVENFLTDKSFHHLNFGPSAKSLSVKDLIDIAVLTIPELISLIEIADTNDYQIEAESLELNSNSSHRYLAWNPKWEQDMSIRKTFEWWINYKEGSGNPRDLCIVDIKNFLE
jgi:CDP-glucose 4,6-dehydratase